MGRGRLEMTMLNKWGTVAFERDLIRRILTDDPYRGVEKWLRMVPPAYRADVAVWVQSSFNAKWAKRLATQDTMHALVADLVCFIEGIEPRDPIPDDGSPWIADPPPWELRPEEHQRRMMDILAAGPIRPGYQHSPATYVEGREAPRRYLPWANAGGPNECQHGYAAGIPCPSCDATVEACARAAYSVGRWEDLPRVTAEHWREVARAVLAAAGRGGK